MKKIFIVGVKKDVPTVLEILHKCGTVQIRDLSKDSMTREFLTEKFEPSTEETKRLEDLLIRINSINKCLPDTEKTGADVEKIGDVESETREIIGKVESDIKEIVVKKNQLELELKTLEKYEDITRKMGPLRSQFLELEGYETTLIILKKEHKGVLNLIESELVRLTKKHFDMASRIIDDEIVTLIVFDKRFSEQVHLLLDRENVSQIRLKKYLTKDSLDKRRKEVKEELERLSIKLKKISEKWKPTIDALSRRLESRYEGLKVASNIGQTDYLFMLEGWIPEKYFNKTKNELNKILGKRISISVTDPDEEELEDVPTMLDNPRIIKPFELFIDIFSVPKYGTIDPTPILAIFFPTFFGLIVGDIGYGLIMLALSFFVMFKSKTNKQLQSAMKIFMICSISSIIFGFVFGEFFGDFGHHLGLHPIWVDRMDAFLPLLTLSIGLGIVHVFLGITIGAINAFREKNRKHLLEKIGLFLSLFGLFFMVATMGKFLTAQFKTPAMVSLLIGIVLLLFSTGITGPLEVFSVFGNIMSYARLMAIGLSSVILAVVANKIAGIMGSIVVGVIIAGLFHTLNIVLAMFSPTIHSIRLHYVEFFKQFYEYGKKYSPFKREENGGER